MHDTENIEHIITIMHNNCNDRKENVHFICITITTNIARSLYCTGYTEKTVNNIQYFHCHFPEIHTDMEEEETAR